MTKDNIKSIIGLLKNELQSIEAAINRHKNEISSMEGMKGRLNIIIEELEARPEEEKEAPEMDITEAVDFFIDERCVIDPAVWEDYNLLYDDFEHFKAQEGIKTKFLKRTFFAELVTRGHYKHAGPGLYFGEPPNSINGLYLRTRRSDIEEEKVKAQKARAGGLEEFWEYQAEKQATEQEIQDFRFENIVKQTEEEEEEEKGGSLFDFRE